MIIDIFNGDGYNHLILLPDSQEIRVRFSADHLSPPLTVRDVKRALLARRDSVKLCGILPPEIGSIEDPERESYLMKKYPNNFSSVVA